MMHLLEKRGRKKNENGNITVEKNESFQSFFPIYLFTEYLLLALNSSMHKQKSQQRSFENEI